MKKVKIIIIGLFTMLLSACDILELKPMDSYTFENYWNTKDQVDRFFIGLHVRLKATLPINYMKLGEFRGGLLEPSISTALGQAKTAANIPIFANTLSVANNGGVINFAGFYPHILQINHAIDKLNNYVTCLTPDEKNYYLGVAHGIRTFFYFHLLRTYGGVPIVDKPEVLGGISSPSELNKKRSTEQQTMAFIKDDIIKSEQYFANSGLVYNAKFGKTYWSKAATLAMKGDVFLWSAKVKPIGSSSVYSENAAADIETARVALSTVWGATGELPENFGNIFTYDNKENAEIIFALTWTLTDGADGFSSFTYSTAQLGGCVDGAGKPLVDPLKIGTAGMTHIEYKMSFFESIPAADQRRAATFQDYYKGAVKGIYTHKFIGTINNGVRSWSNDWPIYRTAEIALMLAECYNAQNNQTEVKRYIELIRKRAYGDDFPTFTYVDKTTTELNILREYAIEFIAENKYWYNVRRMNGGTEALKLVKNNDPEYLLWPIDADVLSKDPLLEQNEAYK